MFYGRRGHFLAPASVWRLEVLRHIHSASRRLPDPDQLLHRLMHSLCLRSALIFQVLISMPVDKCIKSLSSKHYALNSTSLLVSSSGFQKLRQNASHILHPMWDNFFSLHYSMCRIWFLWQFILYKVKGRFQPVLFFFLTYGWLIHLILETLFLMKMWSLVI